MALGKSLLLIDEVDFFLLVWIGHSVSMFEFRTKIE